MRKNGMLRILQGKHSPKESLMTLFHSGQIPSKELECSDDIHLGLLATYSNSPITCKQQISNPQSSTSNGS